jgi:hypothetical protein
MRAEKRVSTTRRSLPHRVPAKIALISSASQFLSVSKGVSSFENPYHTSRHQASVPAIPPLRGAFRMSGHSGEDLLGDVLRLDERDQAERGLALRGSLFGLPARIDRAR